MKDVLVAFQEKGTCSVVKEKKRDVVTRADFGEAGAVGDAMFYGFAAHYPAESLFDGYDGLPFVVTRPGKPRTASAVGTEASAEVNQNQSQEGKHP
jgi:hypothetical protein